MPTQGDLNIFPNAINPLIIGSSFTNITNGNPTKSSKVNGFEILLHNVSYGAFHNAAERRDPPKCHPRTRLAIRKEIMEWIKAPRSMRKLILWMYGPAGSGKTAIVQSIAEECERQGLLAASFFSWRPVAGLNGGSRFAATLAYQLCRSIPQMRDHLFLAIEEDPVIFSRSLSTQMRVLVIEPLKRAAPTLSMPIAAILDAVDECGPNGESQSELLHQLGTVALELQHLPLIFIIASRPEYEIREAFNGHHLSSLTDVLVLDDSYKPGEDIKLYFDSTFHEIYEKNVRLGSRLPSPWPKESDIDFLVSKASGQFIFASTVTKFVDSPRYNPVDRLNIFLSFSSGGNNTAFAPLDALYRFILGSITDIEDVLEVLALLLLQREYNRELTLDEAEVLLGLDIRRALVDMHALLFVPPATDYSLPRIYHASLSDFLMDESRSLAYYIDDSRRRANLCRHWLRVIKACPYSPSDGTLFAIDAFVYHCGYLHSPANQEVVDELAFFDLRAILERISDFRTDLYWPDWHGFMDCVEEQGGGRKDVFPRLQNDFDSFILDRIDQYPQSLQPYVPILLLGFEECDDMLDLVLHSIQKSAEELNKLREVDKMLLDISADDNMNERHYIIQLLEDEARAGRHFASSRSYASLAKTAVSIICARPGEKNYGITFQQITSRKDRYIDDGFDPTTRIHIGYPDLHWFVYVLSNASIDLDFALFLRERAVQFRNDVEPVLGRKNIAAASVEYIQRCGIPFLEHAHQPHTNECAICTRCKGAVVVESIPTVLSEEPPPRSPPNSIFSGADVESILALADAFDVTPYPFTHALQFSPSLEGAIMVSFVGDKSPFDRLM